MQEYHSDIGEILNSAECGKRHNRRLQDDVKLEGLISQLSLHFSLTSKLSKTSIKAEGHIPIIFSRLPSTFFTNPLGNSCIP